MNAEAFTGRIVVIMPVRNEGDWALKTVRNLRASKAPLTDLHFFIVDDCSTDGCCDIFMRGNPDDITLIRTPTDGGMPHPNGQGVARSLAVMRNPGARGFYSIDAHETMETKHGIERLVFDAEESGGIVMARSKNLATGSNVGIGCRWCFTGSGESLRFKGNWIRGVETTGLVPVDALAGACYAWTPQTWAKLQGTRESYGFYGLFDIDLSIAARFTGVPVNCNADVIAGHLYRGPRPYAMSGRWRWWGYVECFRSMFRPEIWERHFAPSARAVCRKLRDPMLEWLINTPRLLTLQADFEKRKVTTDEAVLQWMGIA